MRGLYVRFLSGLRREATGLFSGGLVLALASPAQAQVPPNWQRPSGTLAGAGLALDGEVFARVTDRILYVLGSGGPDKIVVRLNGEDFSQIQVDVHDDGTSEFTFDRARFDRIVVSGRGGDDLIRLGGAFSDTQQTTISGGPGDDTLLGGPFAEVLQGGDGNDFIDGNAGADTVLMGAGNDTFVWDPGDFNDTIEGEGGRDTLIFNGSNAAEIFDIVANGPRVSVLRNVANVFLSVNGIEQINCNAMGEADIINIGNLAGTNMRQVNADLAALGFEAADGANDLVTFTGRSTAETFNVSADGNETVITGPVVQVRVRGFEVADVVRMAALGGDRVNVNGSDGPDNMFVIAAGAVGAVDAGLPARLELSGALTLVLNGLGGDDTLVSQGNVAGLFPVEMNGGDGDDDLLGSNGADLLTGGDGHDFIDGQQGSDVALGGADDDTFQWDPGDGNDILEGQDGFDALRFNGSNGDEIMALADNGGRLRFTRNIGAIVMDLDGVEQVDCFSFGGTDAITVSDLGPTALELVNIDLAAIGGVAGDALPDVVNLVGTPGPDTFDFSADGSRVLVGGLGVPVRIRGFEAEDRAEVVGAGGDLVNINGTDGPDLMTVTPSNVAGRARVSVVGYAVGVDVTGALTLSLNGLDSDDTIAGQGNLAALVPLVMDGGEGDDDLFGSNGADLLLGGAGNDFIDGQQGLDTAHMGLGDDTFQWDPGDGNDIVEGEEGLDALRFNGSNGSEIFELAPNGARLRFTRNIGAIVMDLEGVEQVDCLAFGGTDAITVNDLTGTAVEQVNLDLAAFGGGAGDTLADDVTVNGTGDPDVIAISANAGDVLIDGLWTAIRIAHAEAALDELMVRGLGGVDDITTGPGVNGLIGLTVLQD